MPTEVKYRAICNDCDFTGNWKLIQDNAKADARDHRTEKPSHAIDIEEKTSRTARRKFR